eukprot:g7643.t1
MTDSVTHPITTVEGAPSGEPLGGGGGGGSSHALNMDDERQQSKSKETKAEPLTILVRDQSGAGLQFKVRKNTKFEKVMLAFCQKRNYQMSQVRFLYDGERVQRHQTPQSVDMEEGDIIDCVIEQLGGNKAQF